MFRLKVDWKKRIIIGLLNIIPMIALVTVFIIICVKKDIPDGGVVAIICSLVFLLGVPELIFFEKDRTKRLDYLARKEEESWHPSAIGWLIRISMFVIVLIYFIIVLCARR
jgi:hypothetical protein